MRRFALVFAVLFALGIGLALHSGSVSLPLVVGRLLGLSDSGPFVSRAIDVDTYPVRAASRRLLKPLGFIRLTRVLPAPVPAGSSGSSSSSAGR